MEEQGNPVFTFTKERLIIIGVVILIVWFSLLIFWYLKADEITKDPCNVCAKRFNKNVTCTLSGALPVQRTYLPNGTIVDTTPKIYRQQSYPNLSEINITVID